MEEEKILALTTSQLPLVYMNSLSHLVTLMPYIDGEDSIELK